MSTLSSTATIGDGGNCYWRIGRELGRHVWPTIPSPPVVVPASVDDDGGGIESRRASAAATAFVIAKEEAAVSTRRRVMTSLALMIGGKGIAISTPFVFGALVDSLGGGGTGGAAAAAGGGGEGVGGG